MKTVLIADDEPAVTNMLASQIAGAGYETKTVADGEQALEFIEKNHPDLVILDIFMPRLSGAEVLISMRDHKETEKMPVIVLSGIGCRAKKDGGIRDRYAPDCSFMKPWNPKELISEIQHLIGPEPALSA